MLRHDKERARGGLDRRIAMGWLCWMAWCGSGETPGAAFAAGRDAIQLWSAGPLPQFELPFMRTNFSGLAIHNSRIPPDTGGGVGPEHIMVVLNSEIGIQNRSGRLLSRITLANFWQNAGHQTTFDPRVVYDRWSRRWVITTLADPGRSSSALLVAVSQSYDPTGAWTRFQVPADPQGKEWLDYPNVGYNEKWLVVTINTMSIATNNFLRASIFVFDQRFLTSDPLHHYTRFADPYFTVVPAVNFDPNTSSLFLVSESGTTQTNTVSQLRLSRIDGEPGQEFYATNFAQNPSASPWAFIPSTMNFAPQKGSPFRIAANDSRIQSCVQRNGKLWCVHHVFLPVGTNVSHSAIQWWQFDANGVTLQQGRLEDPAGAVHYLFPSLAVNRSNDVLIGFSRFATDAFASAGYAYRLGSDPPNALSSAVVYRAGLAPYHREDDEGGNRWGDFSATLVDPLNDMDLWTFQEYAESPDAGGDRWGTGWAWLGFQPQTPPEVVSPPADQSVWRVGTNVTLTAETRGSPPLVYQWTFNHAPIAAATNASYSITDFQAAAVGSYALLVSNEVGYARSEAAYLGFVPPRLAGQPISQVVAAGASVALSAEASGTYPLSYQWKWNETNVLSGEISATLVLTNFLAPNEGWYSVVVTNIAGVASIQVAQLTLQRIAPPNLSDPYLGAGGAFEMSFFFDARATITIQRSVDLVHWTDLTRFESQPDAIFVIQDPASLTEKKRFYRAQAVSGEP